MVKGNIGNCNDRKLASLFDYDIDEDASMSEDSQFTAVFDSPDPDHPNSCPCGHDMIEPPLRRCPVCPRRKRKKSTILPVRIH